MKFDTYVIIFVVLILAFAGFYFFVPEDKLFIMKSSEKSLQQKFITLSGTKTSLCSGPQFIDEKTSQDRLQGSCCSPMDFHRYTEQIEGLKKYSKIEQIPKDPYDIPVTLARELLDYQKNIILTESQKKIYDEAVSKSMEGGPCCCKCWRWYAFEGLAKYLITEKNFDAEQIADMWELSDGCGGQGHEHDGL